MELGRAASSDASGRQISVGGGPQVGVRSDVTIGGPLRARIEAATGGWALQATRLGASVFDRDDKVTTDTIRVRQAGAAIGVRGGRRPLCAYGLAGVSLHSLAFPDATMRGPGKWLLAGVEGRVGARGLLQFEVQVHAIGARDWRGFASTTALVASAMAGWAYRF